MRDVYELTISEMLIWDTVLLFVKTSKKKSTKKNVFLLKRKVDLGINGYLVFGFKIN